MGKHVDVEDLQVEKVKDYKQDIRILTQYVVMDSQTVFEEWISKTSTTTHHTLNKKPTLHTHLTALHSWVKDSHSVLLRHSLSPALMDSMCFCSVFNFQQTLVVLGLCRVQFKRDSIVLHFIIVTPLRPTPTFLGLMCIYASV